MISRLEEKLGYTLQYQGVLVLLFLSKAWRWSQVTILPFSLCTIQIHLGTYYCHCATRREWGATLSCIKPPPPPPRQDNASPPLLSDTQFKPRHFQQCKKLPFRLRNFSEECSLTINIHWQNGYSNKILPVTLIKVLHRPIESFKESVRE